MRFRRNPFEVLGLNHTASHDDVKQAYRKLSVKVHPDKNPGNDRAQPAFEIVKAAADRLEDEERLQFCVRICSAAQEAVERKVASQKKKLRKEGQPDAVPEDDPDKLSVSIKVMICRMFAEFEQRKKQLEKQDAEAKKKAQEELAEKEFLEALRKKEEKMWEKSRQKRVNGWRAWENAGGHKSKARCRPEARPLPRAALLTVPRSLARGADAQDEGGAAQRWHGLQLVLGRQGRPLQEGVAVSHAARPAWRPGVVSCAEPCAVCVDCGRQWLCSMTLDID